MEAEEIIFGIITSSGEARSSAFEALNNARNGNFEECKRLLKLSSEQSLESHNIQTDLIQKEAQGNNTEVSLLMVHAQDHLMTSILAKELITEMVHLYERLDQIEKKIK